MLRSPMLKVLPPAKAVVLGCLAAAVVAWAPTAGAQGSCTIVWSDTLLDTTYSCIASPIRDRAFDLETFRAADGGDYLMMSRGNELQIFSLGGDPLHPGSVDTSAFRFGTAGDSDYDVMSFDVCDGCRYGVMDHKVAGTVVFDLGTGTPRFATFSRQGTLSAGSIVFKQGSQQYLITAGLQSGCAGSALYAVNGVNNLSLLQCLEAAGTAFKSVGGEAYGGVLYLGGGLFAEAHIFQATGTGLDLRLQYLSKPSGMIGFHRALAIDPNYRILASADIRNRTIRFWDVSSPTNPVLKPYTINPINAGYVSLRSANASAPLVLAAHGDGWLNSARTFLVDPVTGPEAMNHAFWTDLEEPHNAFQTCVLDQGNALAPDGSALYMGRYATAQVFDLSQCMGPVQAVAEVTVTPSPVFPGGAVTVRDVSTGSYDRWALWVENSSGTVVAGTKTPSAAIPHTLSFTVPVNVGANETFTARITIESSELPPLVSQDSAAIVINRTPQASFTVTPDAAIVGD
nr:hypothetical protein [Thermoanaerobaculales bacterium]